MDIVVGLIMLAAGLALAFAGLRVFILALPILGFIAGMSLGLAIMYWAFDEGFLATAAGIIVGFLFGLFFAALSYMFWYLAVLLGAAAIGASLGAGLMNIFNVDTNWVIVLAALIGAILVAMLTVALELPIYWVVVVTAFNGAAWAVVGVMLLFNQIEREELTYGTLWAAVEESWLWIIAWVLVAAVGMGSQRTKFAEAMLPQEKWTKVPPARM
ncbi:hypothetical protein BH20CHL4_BH20CHL4_09210 [soil metagenome]